MAEKPPAPALRDFALQLEAYERQQELGTYPLRVPTKPAMHSDLKPATCSDGKPAGLPI
jgi:hypothetical protein